MARRRPCKICRRWFTPHPRTGPRQRACGSPACQRERHRRACRAWHRRNPDYDREDRLRSRLQRATVRQGGELPRRNPLGEVDWQVARDAVGLEVIVVIEETSKVLWRGVRDVVGGQLQGMKAVTSKVRPPSARDDIAKPPPAP